MPLAHAWPVAQQASPLAPQQVPFSQVPAAQAVLFATHRPSVSQQPSSVGGPLHLLLAQHTFPCAPHCWQDPAAQTSLTPQVVPASRHVPPMQQLPPVHWFDAQQISVDPPHFVQVPAVQTFPAVLQFVLLPTQVLSAESQHAPGPVHAVPLKQHAEPLGPQVEHVPWKQTLLAPAHARSDPTHVLSVGSQQSVAARHAAPGQQVPPVPPQGEQVPLVQMTLVPWQACVSPTHLLETGSQQPLAQGVGPEQQALPVMPHAGASNGASFGASPAESAASLATSAAESLPESALESWPPLDPSPAASFDDCASASEVPSVPIALSETVPSCELPS
jgi:hypothetical protein